MPATAEVDVVELEAFTQLLAIWTELHAAGNTACHDIFSPAWCPWDGFTMHAALLETYTA